MKVKVVLTKGSKNNKITRTLNFGKKAYSKTTESSLNDLSLPITNNNVGDKKINDKNNKSKSKSKLQSNSKTKLIHTVIKAKEKPTKTIIAQTEKNRILNKTNDYSTISNIIPFQVINEEKRRKFKARENSYSNATLKKYNFKNNYFYKYDNLRTNFNDKNKNIYLKTPIRMRKINQYLNSNNDKQSNIITIFDLQKELEILKRENIYKTMLVTNMKQQIEENKNQQKIIQENTFLKEEIEILKNKCNNTNEEIAIDEDLRKSKNIRVDLFDKLKYEYFNSQNKVNELKKQNKELKNELNKINNKTEIKRVIEKKIIGNSSNNNIENNGNSTKQGNNSLNSYIENKYKLILAQEKEDINNYYKPLKEDQLNEIRFLIKMTLNSNNIPKNKILDFVINNLTNLNDIINSIIADYLKTNSTFDKVLLRHYFTSICYNCKNKTFNINNLFSEINYYYIGIETIINNIQKIHHFISNNENIKQLINECKFKDQFNIGIIELNQFNEIFIGAYGNFINNEKNKELYDLLIYAMKNYYNLNDLGLYHLCYQNLNYETFQRKINKSKTIKNVNDKENDNLGKNEDEINDIFTNNYYISSNNSENNSKNNSYKYSNTNSNKKSNSNEDVFADVSINVEQSTALVNVKFKNNNDSDYDNNSVVQTSINGINSNVNNEEYIVKNENNEEEENILFTSEDHKVCINFVTHIFEYCMDKLQRDKNHLDIIFERF